MVRVNLRKEQRGKGEVKERTLRETNFQDGGPFGNKRAASLLSLCFVPPVVTVHGLQDGQLTVRCAPRRLVNTKESSMKSVTKKVLTESTEQELKIALGAIQRVINSRSIKWENAQGEERECPFNVFSHTGRVDTSRDIDPVAWDAGCAVLQRCESERRNGGNMVSLKAGHQKKASTTSATVRTTGLRASDTPVLVQLAEAQRLANQARMISSELFRRAEAEAERIALLELEADAIALKAFRAKQAEATLAALALKAEAASYAVAEAVEAGDVTVDEVDELNAELQTV